MAKKIRRPSRRPKLKLRGFNNLTKTLSFNIYDVCYARSPQARKEYLEYIDEEYNSKRLVKILGEVSDIIGANVLNISSQDYDPMGASVTVLIAEEPVDARPDQVLAHLDKSHLCIHTYPETDSKTGISTFRVDVDVSTCGKISPLKALNHLIRSFESDIVLMDYKVRGFTRDVRGKKHYIDHRIHSIQQYIDKKILDIYSCVDINIHQENLFHTKMLLRDFNLENYLFASAYADFSEDERDRIKESLKREMTEIFYSKNIYGGPR
ncbi:MAG: adenosylmethionine decarboxylase [Geoalkalibacter sp.]|jgi:S-adenosylmethionine decarboxylase|uniref:Adenosylmethionine decarboxylase n=1 Tax=Geoalkalibacter subterraneus TaxID=483547 RepID=A0A0B5FGN8_9BACT|nr:adenosylmethionine decarboxylase [Geoalkalibacter subterraneus]AJF07332.1 S-adenosylmethionine decarboxylase [Geoalkalibacter subterraneus]